MEGVEEFKVMNAALMRKYPNHFGRLFLNVTTTLPGGSQIQGRTTDKHNITVDLNNPISQPLRGWVEVVGKSTGSGFKCHDIFCFEDDENSAPLDEDAHNEICFVLDVATQRDLYTLCGQKS